MRAPPAVNELVGIAKGSLALLDCDVPVVREPPLARVAAAGGMAKGSLLGEGFEVRGETPNESHGCVTEEEVCPVVAAGASAAVSLWPDISSFNAGLGGFFTSAKKSSFCLNGRSFPNSQRSPKALSSLVLLGGMPREGWLGVSVDDAEELLNTLLPEEPKALSNTLVAVEDIVVVSCAPSVMVLEVPSPLLSRLLWLDMLENTE